MALETCYKHNFVVVYEISDYTMKCICPVCDMEEEIESLKKQVEEIDPKIPDICPTVVEP